MNLNYLDLSSTDAEFNLAAEQYVFDVLPRDRVYLMLWQNRRAVIVGKHQNTMAEINAGYVRAHQVQVVRRLSGGGAVYHDLGNLNYSIVADAGSIGALDMKAFCQPVIRALRKLGVPAEINGRNDLTVDGKKFSGAAQYIKQGRILHHGTLLFSSDLDAMCEALRVDDVKIRAKGVPSVRSRVANLREFTDGTIGLPEFRSHLLQTMLRENPGEKLEFSEEDLHAVDHIRRERYSRWDWNYGSSPACAAEKKRYISGCGTVSASLSTDKAVISSLAFHGDFFSTLEPELLAEKVLGTKLEESALRQKLSELNPDLYLSGMTADALIDLLLS